MRVGLFLRKLESRARKFCSPSLEFKQHNYFVTSTFSRGLSHSHTRIPHFCPRINQIKLNYFILRQSSLKKQTLLFCSFLMPRIIFRAKTNEKRVRSSVYESQNIPGAHNYSWHRPTRRHKLRFLNWRFQLITRGIDKHN